MQNVSLDRYIMADIRDAVNRLHASGRLHETIISNPARFLNPNARLGSYLAGLKEQGKKVFLLTNSPYKFVDAGMTYLLQQYLGKYLLPF